MPFSNLFKGHIRLLNFFKIWANNEVLLKTIILPWHRSNDGIDNDMNILISQNKVYRLYVKSMQFISSEIIEL